MNSEDNKLLTNYLRERISHRWMHSALPNEWRKILKTCSLSVIEPFNLQNQVQLHLIGQNVSLRKAVSNHL